MRIILSNYISPLLVVLLFPYLVCGQEAGTSTVRLNYVVSTNRSTLHYNKSSLEASCREMSLVMQEAFNNTEVGSTTNFDGVEILCQDMNKSSFCHLSMNYNDNVLIHSTISSYRSSLSSVMRSSIIEVDVSIRFFDRLLSRNIETITQEALISLATDGIPTFFSLEHDADASWTIVPSFGKVDSNEGNTLGQVVLSRSADEVSHKKRVYASKHIQVWEYSTPKSEPESSKVISVFINQVLRFTTATMSSIIHAEALVHPAMVSHPEPKRVLIISDFPTAILDELQKYDTSLVERIDVSYTSPEVQKLIGQYLPSNFGKQAKIPVTFYNDLDHIPNMQDSTDEPLGEFWDSRVQESNDYMDPQKNLHQKSRTICYDEKTALANKRAGYDWERHLTCGENTILDLKDDGDDDGGHADVSENDLFGYDVILIDIPSYFAAELLSTDFQRKLKSLLDDDDGLLAVSIGSPPDINDFFTSSSSPQRTAERKKEYKMSLRDIFLREAARHPKNHGIGYKHVAVYDEPLASPLASSFIVAFRSMYSDSYSRFYRSASAAIDFDIIHRLTPKETNGLSAPPTIIYDGSTQLHYKVPSRTWEIWYCNTPPGMNLPACSVLRSDIFDLKKQKSGVEVRRHPVKGRAVYATEPMAINDFVNFGDTAHQFTIDAADWKSLNKFIERYPEATRYKELRDWIVAYGYENLSLGMSGWSVSIASNNTFINHACCEQEVKTAGCDFIFMNEDNEQVVVFSPVINRHPYMAGVSQCVIREVSAGDELAMDYEVFRADPGPYFQLFLTEMCQGGKGLVVGDKDQPKSEL